MAHGLTAVGVLGAVRAAEVIQAINWQAPWLAPLADVGQGVATGIVQGLSTHAALNAHLAKTPLQPPVRFVSQSALPAGQAYENYIFNSGSCPTREGLHDLFNGLCWIHFPQTKARLNQLHMAQMTQRAQGDGGQMPGPPGGPVRGPVRDALTVFDENAAFLQASDAMWNALAAKDWHSLFVTQRPLWKDAKLVLFGHALLEKLVAPRKAITAHVYRVHPSSQTLADLDSFVAHDLSAEKLATKPFAHLPVLAVPGWWPANENAGFYDDATVFRQPRLL